MSPELYNHINNLLSYLRSAMVVELVRQYYAKYGNDAPPTLIEYEINALQKLLDESENAK